MSRIAGFFALIISFIVAGQALAEKRLALEFWDRTGDLGLITAPTLIIGAGNDTMDPVHMEWMVGEVKNGGFLLCPDGSHLSQYDDEAVFFEGLIRFIKDVDAGEFPDIGAAAPE